MTALLALSLTVYVLAIAVGWWLGNIRATGNAPGNHVRTRKTAPQRASHA